MKPISRLLSTFEALDAFIIEQHYSRCFILADSNTLHHCLPTLTTNCEQLCESEVFEIEPGEASKSIAIASGLWEALIESGADRSSCIICLGGGVITDLGGFVACTFKRGIPYIYVPTTILAMVDAAIGGKNGINVGAFKNQAGCFGSPDAIVVNNTWLSTLPFEELRSGYAEMLKHALLVSDPDHLASLLNQSTLNHEALTPYLGRSRNIKMGICEADPFEQNTRKMLNLGHTAGHAFESASHDIGSPLLHGEAIARGLLVSLHLSQLRCGFPESWAVRISDHIRNTFAIQPDDCMLRLPSETLWPYLLADKKNTENEVRFALLKALGSFEVSVTVTFEEFTETLNYLNAPS